MLKKARTILNNSLFLIKTISNIRIDDGIIYIPSSIQVVVDGDIKINTVKEKNNGEVNRIYLNCD